MNCSRKYSERYKPAHADLKPTYTRLEILMLVVLIVITIVVALVIAAPVSVKADIYTPQPYHSYLPLVVCTAADNGRHNICYDKITYIHD